jgi:hypothetical protein
MGFEYNVFLIKVSWALIQVTNLLSFSSKKLSLM